MWQKPHSLLPLQKCPKAYLEPSLSKSKEVRSRDRKDSLLQLPHPLSRLRPTSSLDSYSRMVIFFKGDFAFYSQLWACSGPHQVRTQLQKGHRQWKPGCGCLLMAAVNGRFQSSFNIRNNIEDCLWGRHWHTKQMKYCLDPRDGHCPIDI